MTRFVLIFLIILFWHSLINAQYVSELKLKNNHSITVDTNKTIKYRSSGNAFAAGALSLIVPGFALGQVYNGDWDQFSTHISISVACLAGTFISAVLLTHNGIKSMGWYFVLLGTTLVYTANWVWSIIDAASTADEMDRQKQLKNHSSELIDKLGLGFTFDKKNPKLIFSVRL